MKSFACRFLCSTIGKKFLVAISGLGMVGFLVAHMVGNMQIFAGRGPTPAETLINQYAAMLHANEGILWVARLGLIAMILIHIWATVSLTRKAKKARGQDYLLKKSAQSTAASRMMIYGGMAIFFYIIYHLAHFTFGYTHGDLLVSGDLYQSMVSSFSVPWISGIYILAQVFLYFHLFHGISSVFFTLGVAHPRYRVLAIGLGHGLAAFITAGFISIPLGVLFGIVA